jgi:hypothetical protein
MKARFVVGLLVAGLFGIAVASSSAGVVGMSPGSFTFTFDENGNGSLVIAGGATFVVPGVLLADPTNPGTVALTYDFSHLGLPGGELPLGNGDLGVLEPGSRFPSDGIRFTDANGTLTGATADRMIFYSDAPQDPADTDLADTGLPTNFNPGTTVGEDPASGLFQYGNGTTLPNIYLGHSDTEIPEPCALIVWSLLGLCGLAAGWWRRRS